MKEEPLLFPWLMDNVQLPAGSTPAPRDFMEVSGMPDREKVVKGYECCLRITGGCKDCPYWDQTRSNKCERKLKEDAIELLKEQEVVVWCKDCKNVCMEEATEMMPDMPFYAVCTLTDEVHEPEWFCADGERKAND